MTARFIVGDTRAVLATLEPGSVDLILTSPPFLALRSYLPAGHPDKAHEIGSEPTPGAYIDTLLDVVEACSRVLAPHGSMMFELGDTYAGSGGEGGDLIPGSGDLTNRKKIESALCNGISGANRRKGEGWPLDRSLCLIPELFRISLVYGFNPLTGRRTPRWRARNVVRWCRPNPPVGALGDKFRPATSELVVLCRNRRYFDLDAVRTEPTSGAAGAFVKNRSSGSAFRGVTDGSNRREETVSDPAGAPPLDWWKIPTQPFSGVWQGDTFYRASPDCPEHSLRAIRQRLHTGSSGELREALLRNSRRTDLHPDVKQACALHASSDLESKTTRHAMTDWLDLSIRSERTTESIGVNRTPALPGRSDDAPDPGVSAARTAARTSRTPTASTTTDQTSAQMTLECAPSATPHNTASNRTDPGPSTSPAGTPSAETAVRIDGMSMPPELSDQEPSTPLSSTGFGADPETGGHTVRTPSRRCSCEQFTESGSHYACWPEQLCVIPVKAMCPARVCRTCGKPSERIIKPSEEYQSRPFAGRGFCADASDTDITGQTERNGWRGTAEYKTVGWSDCHHNNWRPGLVLDPFAGSGTTLQVATGHGRDAIGIDLDHRNAQLALGRVGPLLLSVETREVA